MKRMEGRKNLKILKLKLFQESACYKKPFAFKVAETYPLPPYSTVIGMFHKILQASPGEYFPMNISIQGEYESIFSNYQTLRSYKSKMITSMPRNVHQLFHVNLVIHVQAEDEMIDKIYFNILHGLESFTLGRNEDIVRVDEIRYVDEAKVVFEEEQELHRNAYVPDIYWNEYTTGIHYQLNSQYEVEDGIRKWKKVNVKYAECMGINVVQNVMLDEEKDIMFFMNA